MPEAIMYKGRDIKELTREELLEAITDLYDILKKDKLWQTIVEKTYNEFVTRMNELV